MRLRMHISTLGKAARASTGARDKIVTRREREILDFVSARPSNKQIDDKLHIPVPMIKRYHSVAFENLRMRNCMGALAGYVDDQARRLIYPPVMWQPRAAAKVATPRPSMTATVMPGPTEASAAHRLAIATFREQMRMGGGEVLTAGQLGGIAYAG